MNEASNRNSNYNSQMIQRQPQQQQYPQQQPQQQFQQQQIQQQLQQQRQQQAVHQQQAVQNQQLQQQQQRQQQDVQSQQLQQQQQRQQALQNHQMLQQQQVTQGSNQRIQKFIAQHSQGAAVSAQQSAMPSVALNQQGQIQAQQKRQIPQQVTYIQQPQISGQAQQKSQAPGHVVNNQIPQTEEEINRQLIEAQLEIEKNNKVLREAGLPVIQPPSASTESPVPPNANYVGSVRLTQPPSHVFVSSQQPFTNSIPTQSRPVSLLENPGAVQNCSINNSQFQQLQHMRPKIISGQNKFQPRIMQTTPRGPNQIHSTSVPNQSPVQVSSISTNQTPSTSPLQKINKKNVVLEGGGQFEEGQAYMIKDRQGNSRKCVWRNGEFVPMEQNKSEFLNFIL